MEALSKLHAFFYSVMRAHSAKRRWCNSLGGKYVRDISGNTSTYSATLDGKTWRLLTIFNG